MNRNSLLKIIALGSTCLVSTAALAEDDDFGISDAPAPAAKPVYDSFIEAGVGYSSADDPRFGRYTGLTDPGAFAVGNFDVLYRGPWNNDDTLFFRGYGRDLGLDSRSIAVEGGWQGTLKLSVGYDSIPFEQFEGHTPFRGVGSGSLTLPSNWISNPSAQSTTATQRLPNLNSSLQQVDIGTERHRYTTGMLWHIDPAWSLKLGFQREDKEGTKPLGVAWGTSGGNPLSVIVPETVDYQTDRISAEVGYAGKVAQAQLAYEMSAFTNEVSTLNVQNPFSNSGWPDGNSGRDASFPNGRAQMQLAPDNTAHSVRFGGGYEVTDKTRVTTNGSFSQYRQNEDFLNYTANPLLTVVQGLPRGSLDGEIDTVMGNIELYSRPLTDIDVKTRYRYTDRYNRTPESLFVYVAGDAEDQQTGGTQSRYRFNRPYSYTEHLGSADFGYMLLPRTKVIAGYEVRLFERTDSERDENEDHTVRLQARSTISKDVAVNGKYSRMWRDGSNYVGAAPLLESSTTTFIQSLGAAVFENHPLLRKYYMADLTRDIASAGVTYSPIDGLSLGASGSFTNDDYRNSAVGLENVSGWSGTLDAAYAITDRLSVSAFYTLDRRTADQVGWSIGSSTAAGKITDAANPARRWWVTHNDLVHTLGVGTKVRVLEPLALSFDYALTDAVTEINSGSGGAFVATGLPDVTTRTHTLSIRAEYDVTESIQLGIGYAFERYRSTDWALDSISITSSGRVLTLGELSPDYDAHLVLVTTRLRF